MMNYLITLLITIKCQVEGTVGGNQSCSLETGQCYCKENVEGRTCDHCSAGAYNYPECETCPCDLRGTTEDICDQVSLFDLKSFPDRISLHFILYY